ncbi:asparagine synthase (glutamine-hydrolyzing) [Phenylobacterium sp.]|uniref:asparagine synthase (glutamine-hydrolyzing) n=1 Tax=Phenylobacterium sp. TaxID=1871053 RepID=UPI0025F3BC18|nr:asparagine synthase (glutamine-hydrolyzing) [Phenylobacterium sp.]
MCGIAGQLGGADNASAERMIHALGHRGPNGVRTEAAAGARLAHARLSIIDLDGGWQPLHAAGGTVIGNGEIYNYVELARDFGLTTATGSDFEPLLHLYAREGEAAFRRLRGMYAFCLIGADGRAWLARDPFGIKPLYIMEHAGGLAFASEPRAFFAAGLVQRALDEGAARELVELNYVLGERSPFQGLRRLAPGEVMEVRDGRIVSGKRRAALSLPLMGSGRAGDTGSSPEPGRDFPARLAGARHPPPEGEGKLLQRLDAVLEDSVRVHQRSDVPYGLFLSGGIDSAAIATLMARLNSRPVTAFTCGFDAPGAKDERAQAEKVARALELDWRETTFGEEDFWRILPQVAWALDDPTADYATLPTYKLAEAAKGTLTVVLTGEGGDELFGGYGRYRRALRPRLLGGRPAEPRGATPEVLAAWREQARAPRGLSSLQAAQWADVVTWLPNDLLLKLDRCLMAHGLEGRTPFLDAEVAAFAWSLPDRAKVRGGYGKWLLRKWLERACPAAEPWAKKQGFTVPVEAWIAPRATQIGERLGRIEAVRRLGGPPRDEGTLWPWLFFGVWALIHLEGASPADALAAATGI